MINKWEFIVRNDIKGKLVARNSIRELLHFTCMLRAKYRAGNSNCTYDQ